MQRSEATGAKPRLAEPTAALSMATDLGMGQPLEHALRTCVVTVRLADLAGASADEARDAYYLALLRSTGCTATAHGLSSLLGDEIAFNGRFRSVNAVPPAEAMAAMLRHVGQARPPLGRARALAALLVGLPRMDPREHTASHCEVAQLIAQRFGLGAGVQVALGCIFERWDGRGLPRGLRGEALPVPVRIAQLAEDAAAHFGGGGVDAAVAVVRAQAGRLHDPVLVERFSVAASQLLGDIDAPSLWEAALAAEPTPWQRVDEHQVDAVLRAMGEFSDLKSPHTLGHSAGVARLAEAAGRRYGLPDGDLAALRRAALIHDLGRAAVPNSIWDKRGPLTDGERERVRLHAYFTERILARTTHFATLGSLASLHHERMDGSGYHRGTAAAQLPPPARILAAADTYHAMNEPRPHRPALAAPAAAAELQREARAGRLEGSAVEAVLAAAGHRVRHARRMWPCDLTAREVEVLRLVARGLSNRQMGVRLTVSPKTVDHHVRHIYGKIGVSTRAAAALFAAQQDMLGDRWNDK